KTRLYEVQDGTLLMSHQDTAENLEEMVNLTGEAAKILTWELVQLDELATQAMQPPPVPETAPKPKVKRTVKVKELGPETEKAEIDFKAVGAIVGVTLLTVMVPYLLWPLMLVPVVNL